MIHYTKLFAQRQHFCTLHLLVQYVVIINVKTQLSADKVI